MVLSKNAQDNIEDKGSINIIGNCETVFQKGINEKQVSRIVQKPKNLKYWKEIIKSEHQILWASGWTIGDIKIINEYKSQNYNIWDVIMFE